MKYAATIKEIGRGAKGARPLSEADAHALFADILERKVPDLELGAIILSLRIKSESIEELLGFKRAMDEHTPQLTVPEGWRCVVLPSYNGARRQPNLMPLLAMMLARAGVPVLVQGRHDFDARTSPFDLLAALGITPQADVAAASTALASGQVACLKLDSLLPGLDDLLALRPRLGVRNTGHTMAKLLDPAIGRSLRVVAVTHPEYLERMDAFLKGDGGAAMLMRGTEGEAYANPRRRPAMKLYADGALVHTIEAEPGGAPPNADVPDAPDVAGNAALIRDIFDGRVPMPEPLLAQFEALRAHARMD